MSEGRKVCVVTNTNPRNFYYNTPQHKHTRENLKIYRARLLEYPKIYKISHHLNKRSEQVRPHYSHGNMQYLQKKTFHELDIRFTHTLQDMQLFGTLVEVVSGCHRDQALIMGCLLSSTRGRGLTYTVQYVVEQLTNWHTQ